MFGDGSTMRVAGMRSWRPYRIPATPKKCAVLKLGICDMVMKADGMLQSLSSHIIQSRASKRRGFIQSLYCGSAVTVMQSDTGINLPSRLARIMIHDLVQCQTRTQTNPPILK
jgi:hypothetical protein